MNDELIYIEGIDTDQDIYIEGLENGDFSEIEGLWGDVWKGVKSTAKSLVKAHIKPVTTLVKSAVNIVKKNPEVTNLLTSINPALGTFKLGVSLFSDIMKIEKHTGKKVKYGTKFVKNTYSVAYAKGYRDALNDIRAGKIQVTGAKKEVKTTRNYESKGRQTTRTRRGGRH